MSSKILPNRLKISEEMICSVINPMLEPSSTSIYLDFNTVINYGGSGSSDSPCRISVTICWNFSSSVALEIEIFLSLQNISMQESIVVLLTYKYSCVVLLQWMR